MTRDEILNMPAGRKMDRLIVEYVMEWEALACGWIDTKNKSIVRPEFWQPSENIEYAFEVIQKMHKMKYKYTLHGHFMGSELQIATFDHQDWADTNPLYKAVSDSAPLAICRAALLAVMK